MTPDQERQVIDMLEDYKRVGWLWRSISQIAKWVVAVAAATASVAATYKFMMKP